MYNFILERFSKKGKCIPEYIIIFKNSYFDIDILHRKYQGYLCYYSAYEYINSLSDEKWNKRLKYFINMYAQVKNSSCIKCIIKLPNYREIFNKVLIISELNTHGSFEYGDALLLYNSLQHKHKLFFKPNHQTEHRRLLKSKRNRNRQQPSNNNIVEPILPETRFIVNYENVPIPMNLNNYHLIETVHNVVTNIADNVTKNIEDILINGINNNI
jgi:hypothetical protein